MWETHAIKEESLILNWVKQNALLFQLGMLF